MLNNDTERNDLINQCADAVANEMPKNALVTESMQKQRAKVQIEDSLQQYQILISRGVKALLEALDILTVTDPSHFPPSIWEEIEKMKLATQDVTPSEENTLQAFYHLSDETMDQFYQVANYLFQEKRFQEAADVLRFLIALNPIDYPSYYTAYGNAEYYNLNYSQAIHAYALGVYANPQDIPNYLFICKCLEALNQKEEAIKVLDDALSVIQEDESLQTQWLQKIRDYQESLNR